MEGTQTTGSAITAYPQAPYRRRRPDEVPHYHFELPGTPADLHALAAEDGRPRMGDWQRNLDAPQTSYDFTVAQQNSGALAPAPQPRDKAARR